jgi:putative ABC transport system permease protein
VLLAATMLVRSFALTLSTDPGFHAQGLLSLTGISTSQDPSQDYNAYRSRMVPALQSVAGVEQVAAVNSLPMTLGATAHTRFATRFGIPGRAFAPGQFPTAQIRWCTANYLSVMGIPLVSGRLLNENDFRQPRYLVNEALARRYFPNENAAGRKLLLGVTAPNPDAVDIVGVVGNIREFGLDIEPQPTIYLLDMSPVMDIIVQSSGDPRPLRAPIEAAMHQAAPESPVGEARTVDSLIGASLDRQRFVLSLIAVFAGLAMALCAVGIYGVFSYSVGRRMREFGIRSALGAQRRDLARLIARECLTVAVPGLIVGVLMSACSAHFLRALLNKVSPADPLSYAIAVCAILALSLCAAFLPAQRAIRIDPAEVLREA